MSGTATPEADPGPLRQIAAGDPDGVPACLDTYGGMVWSLVSRWLGPGPEAEDVVQEVFVDLWKSADRFDPAKGSEATFVATVARRRLIDRTRRLTRRPRPEPLASWDAACDQPGPDERAAMDEAARAALAAVDELPPPQRRVLCLAVLEGRTHAEIAEACELPLGTVKSWVRRGLMKVRESLAVDGGRPRDE